jgi:hypothetical protein
MATKQLSDGGPDGTTLGQSATDLVTIQGVVTDSSTATRSGVNTFSGSVAFTGSQIDIGNSSADLVGFHGATPQARFGQVSLPATASIAMTTSIVINILSCLNVYGIMSIT